VKILWEALYAIRFAMNFLSEILFSAIFSSFNIGKAGKFYNYPGSPNPSIKFF